MKLNISNALKAPGQPFDFSETLEATAIDESGLIKATDPILVSGTYVGQPGSVFVDAKAQTTLELSCDRCLVRFTLPIDAKLDEAFFKEPPEASNVEGYEIEGDYIDLGLAANNSIFMELPHKRLCKENCKGLCPTCGANLNEGECSCGRIPRQTEGQKAELLKLKQLLLDDKEV